MKFVALCGLATAALASSVQPRAAGEDLSKCATRQVAYDWFGNVAKTPATCDDCTTVTYLTGAGGAACAKYKDFVSTAVPKSTKLKISMAAGILPGAFDNLPANVNWVEIGSAPGTTLEQKAGKTTISSLPSGLFDKAAPSLTEIRITTPRGVTFQNPATFFGVPVPNLKRLTLDFSANEPSVGLPTAQLFNKNIASVQNLQTTFGNPTIPADALVNLVQLRQCNLISNKLTALPPTLLKTNTRLKGLYLAGSDVVNDRYVPMPITVFPNTLLASAKNLGGLQVRGTKVTALAVDTFSKNPKLETVLFMDSNLKTLPAGLISSNPMLKALEVPGNDIASVPATGLFPSDRPIRFWFEPQSTGLKCADLTLPSNVECTA